MTHAQHVSRPVGVAALSPSSPCRAPLPLTASLPPLAPLPTNSAAAGPPGPAREQAGLGHGSVTRQRRQPTLVRTCYRVRDAVTRTASATRTALGPRVRHRRCCGLRLRGTARSRGLRFGCIARYAHASPLSAHYLRRLRRGMRIKIYATSRPSIASLHHVPSSRPLHHVPPSHPSITPLITSLFRIPPSRPFITSLHHVPSSRPFITYLHHVTLSRPFIASLHRVPPSRPFITSLHHVPSSRPFITSLYHVPSSRPFITLPPSRPTSDRKPPSPSSRCCADPPAARPWGGACGGGA